MQEHSQLTSCQAQLTKAQSQLMAADDSAEVHDSEMLNLEASNQQYMSELAVVMAQMTALQVVLPKSIKFLQWAVLKIVSFAVCSYTLIYIHKVLPIQSCQ